MFLDRVGNRVVGARVWGARVAGMGSSMGIWIGVMVRVVGSLVYG